MKYIFLDVDGVLNHDAWLIQHHRSDWDDVADDSRATLGELIRRHPDVRVILSSSWRHGFCTIQKDGDTELVSASKRDVMNKFLVDKLASIGVIMKDKTRSFHERYSRLDINVEWTRDLEILDYVNNHLTATDKFVILDDENIDTHGLFRNHFVRTRGSIGIQMHDIELADKILSGESDHEGGKPREEFWK